ncbi:Unknown protein [Striga hermonthica]|uniref:Uncharacterized protein n=1 Tax=Striga hermonthica TaxID=68872 RepID=A0A9N7N1F3_STRHE|nr:Unknown protein [Striga hermonthica]
MMAARGEFFLSEPIIHHIQSFLNEKEAAQTTVLSKSWRQAWLTRPNLDFDRSHFSFAYEFSDFMDKSIQRYEESNLEIESFSLTMDSLNDLREDVIKALGMGVTRLSLKLHESYASYCSVVPAEVFGCKDLSRGKIALPPEHLVQFPRLKALSLTYVKLQSDEESDEVISGCCPLLEKLSLTLLPKLRHLELTCLTINTLLLGDLSCKFPLLRDLSMQCDYLESDLFISSHSIEHLDIETYLITDTVSLEFDVPSIRKFKFKSGDNLPSSMSFKSTNLREWESHVTMSGFYPYTSMFLALRNFLTQLSPSKLYLTIIVDHVDKADYEMEDLLGLPCTLQLENLMIETKYLVSLAGYALFDGLFRLCRPKCITQHLLSERRYGNEGCVTDDFLCKILERGMKGHYLYPSNFLHGLHGLEEAYVQAPVDEAVGAWRLVTGDLCSDISALASQERHGKKIRFLLKWKEP